MILAHAVAQTGFYTAVSIAAVGHDAESRLGGDKLFVDYAGDMMPVIIDRLTKEVRPA